MPSSLYLQDPPVDELVTKPSAKINGYARPSWSHISSKILSVSTALRKLPEKLEQVASLDKRTKPSQRNIMGTSNKT
nr:hypothetical protein [Candidatus Njordarchaeota archaeon]